MGDNVEPHLHVLYGVWVPTKGWVRSFWNTQKAPYFWKLHSRAKKLATKFGGQLIVFDVVPTLRSWPSLEAPATAEGEADINL